VGVLIGEGGPNRGRGRPRYISNLFLT